MLAFAFILVAIWLVTVVAKSSSSFSAAAGGC